MIGVEIINLLDGSDQLSIVYISLAALVIISIIPLYFGLHDIVKNPS